MFSPQKQQGIGDKPFAGIIRWAVDNLIFQHHGHRAAAVKFHCRGGPKLDKEIGKFFLPHAATIAKLVAIHHRHNQRLLLRVKPIPVRGICTQR